MRICHVPVLLRPITKYLRLRLNGKRDCKYILLSETLWFKEIKQVLTDSLIVIEIAVGMENLVQTMALKKMSQLLSSYTIMF